mgnify:CR=1 FL=1
MSDAIGKKSSDLLYGVYDLKKHVYKIMMIETWFENMVIKSTIDSTGRKSMNRKVWKLEMEKIRQKIVPICLLFTSSASSTDP